MNDIRIPYLQTKLSSQLVELLTHLINGHLIPTKAKRIAVNIRPQEIIELYELWEHNFLAYVEMSASDDNQASRSATQLDGPK